MLGICEHAVLVEAGEQDSVAVRVFDSQTKGSGFDSQLR